MVRQKKKGTSHNIQYIRLFSSLEAVRNSDRFCSNYVSREYSGPFVFSLWFLFFESTTKRDKTRRDERIEITTQIKPIIENQRSSIVIHFAYTYLFMYIITYVLSQKQVDFASFLYTRFIIVASKIRRFRFPRMLRHNLMNRNAFAFAILVQKTA